MRYFVTRGYERGRIVIELAASYHDKTLPGREVSAAEFSAAWSERDRLRIEHLCAVAGALPAEQRPALQEIYA